MGGAVLNKSLIQFSVDGLGCVPSLLFDLRPNYGVGNISRDTMHALGTYCPGPAAGHCRPMLLPETTVHSQSSLGQSLLGLMIKYNDIRPKGFRFYFCLQVQAMLWDFQSAERSLCLLQLGPQPGDEICLFITQQSRKYVEQSGLDTPVWV